MENSSRQMDLDDWEFLSDEAFLDQGRLFSDHHHRFDSNPKGVFDMDYFICPSPRSTIKNLSDSKGVVKKNQVIPIPIEVESDEKKTHKNKEDKVIREEEDEIMVKEVIKVPIVEVNFLTPPPMEYSNHQKIGGDQDLVSQVFFKKPKGNEVIDIKIDSPKSGGRGIKPQIDAGSIHQFEEKAEENEKIEANEQKVSSKLGSDDQEMGIMKKQYLDSSNKHIWKLWRSNGIGAICSVGVAAAATICIFIIGTQQRHKRHQQKLRFQIYADEKSIKQVVQQASKLNQAISVVRGVPATRAHVTFGGYYEGL